MTRKSIRVFVPAYAVGFAVTAAILVVGVSIGAFVYVDENAERLLAQREATIAEEELKLLQDVFLDEGRDGVIRAVARRAALPSDNLGIVAIADQQGNVLVGNVDWPKDLRIDGKWRALSTVNDAEEPVNGFARAISLKDGTRILVGRNFAYSEALRASLSEAMIAALAVLLTATLGLGIWLNRYVLNRIDAIASTTRRISINNLSERIPVGSANTEFEHLGITVNEMLDRNQALIEQMRLMTDAISHDLRLPLQRVRSNLSAAMDSSDADRLKSGIVQAIEDADAALDTFNALLDIARAEAGVGRESFAPVELSALIADVVELFEPLAEEKEQSLEVSVEPATVWGQSMLLKQMFGNLLHNAIKYTPPHGKIKVRLFREEPGWFCITVEDNGPGVPVADRGQVSQRFGRLSRDQASDGKGLGLALASAFAKLHEGNVRLGDADPGLIVTVTLPEFTGVLPKTQSELM